MAAAKIRWGEVEEDDGGDLDFLLPPRVVTGPDENGLKKTVEYRFDDDGNKVKVTTTTRIRKLACTRLSKAAIERRNWSKFGDAASGDDASARLTVVSTEEIFLERPRAPGSSTLFIHPRLGLRRLICFGSTTVLLAIFVIELGWIDLIHCGTRIIKPRLAIYLVYVGTGL
jgi:hypothetical protein